MNAEKKQVAYFATIIIGFGIYATKNLLEQRKLTKRIKRSEGFLVESEALKAKYPNGGDDEGKQMTVELLALIKKYGL